MASGGPGNADFESWLGAQLKALDTDDEVYLPYIVSILEDEDDKAEAIDELLGGISEKQDRNESLRKQILERWTRLQNGEAGAAGSEAATAAGLNAHMDKLDINAALASITESQTAAYAAQRAAKGPGAMGEPDKAVKEAIMAQYAGAVEESSDEDDGDDGVASEREHMKNANTEAVEKANAEKREKCKAAAMAKKEKDKEDREKQKTQGEDRKKKAQDKAAKGERKR
jgi:hypothetical protein